MADTPDPSPAPNGIRLVKPGAPAPIKLKPVVPRPITPAADAAPAAPAPAPAPAAAPAPAPAAAAPAPAKPETPAFAPTVRLKPVAPAPKPLGDTVNLKPVPPTPAENDLSATIQISAPPPLAPTPATPVASEQLQASKSKTSRISLDAALTSGAASGGPRTIRIKRPTDAPVGKLTSQIPPAAAAAPAPAPAAPAAAEPAVAEAPAAEGDVPLSQRRTIRVKRPTAGPSAAASAPTIPSKPVIAASTSTDTPEVVPPEFATDVPPSAFGNLNVPVAVEKTSVAFPIIGILAILCLAVAIFFLLQGDANILNGALWPVARN